jgi:hypothetical protein
MTVGMLIQHVTAQAPKPLAEATGAPPPAKST